MILVHLHRRGDLEVDPDPGGRAQLPLPRSLWGTALLAAGLLLAACAPQSKKQDGPPGGAAVPVTVSAALSKDVPVTIRAIGSVEAANTVLVRARIGGELTRVAFVEGQEVRRGDLLFGIDPRPFENALASAVADSVRDTARAASAAADLVRYAGLLPKEYVTQQQYDAAKTNAEASQAAVEADRAALRSARLSLSFCSIRAPISGRTGRLSVREGNLITPNGEPLVTIQQLVPAYVSFSVPEQRLAEIRRYSASSRLRVEVTISGDSAAVRAGELTFVDNAVDETTGMVLLKATFPNEDESLWPGQFVDASLVLTTMKDAVVVPAQAVQRSQQGDMVYVVGADLTAAMRPVTVAFRVGPDVCLAAGIHAGEQVVTDGQLRLIPGGKVEIKSGLQSAGGGAPGK